MVLSVKMFCITDKTQTERTPLLTPTTSAEPEAARRRLRAPWRRSLAAVRKRVSLDKNPSRGSPVPGLQTRLREAVAEGWERRFHSRYRAVKVFLTYWADTDDPAALDTGSAARALADLFGRVYGFDVETWLIPSLLEPQWALSAKLGDLVRTHGKEGDLLIFWYGGPAMETDDGSGPLVWFGERFGARINSSIVPMILGSSEGDVLTLYDCEASPRAETANGSGVIETLAASTHGCVSGFAGRDSFTRSLVRILEKQRHVARGIAVLDIHRKLVNQARRGRTPYEADGRADAQKRAGGGPQAALSPGAMRPSPGYCRLSRCGARSEGKQATIAISRLNYPLEAFGPNGVGEELEMTVRLRLRGNETNVGRWTDWITSAPPEAAQVHTTISRGCTPG